MTVTARVGDGARTEDTLGGLAADLQDDLCLESGDDGSLVGIVGLAIGSRGSQGRDGLSIGRTVDGGGDGCNAVAGKDACGDADTHAAKRVGVSILSTSTFQL